MEDQSQLLWALAVCHLDGIAEISVPSNDRNRKFAARSFVYSPTARMSAIEKSERSYSDSESSKRKGPV